ncbi:MAG: SpoIIE family protein phosphatase [Muribaculaceae bacterium]|nr:SpoIIE family protein phosphatase [Muribaculaceae bacterium]
MSKGGKWFSLLRQSRSTMLVLVACALLLACVFAAQHYYARKGIENEVAHRAEAALTAKALNIQYVVTSVEVAVENMAWAAERGVARPDSLYKVVRRVVSQNDYIVGSAVAFEPDFFPEKGRLFAQYCYQDTVTDELHLKSLASDEYNYLQQEWYTAPMKTDAPCWSEPYFDVGGGDMAMTTFSIPLHDKQGRCVGVLTADISLDWLDDELYEGLRYSKSYFMIMSHKGVLMAYPDTSLILTSPVTHMADKGVRDPAVDELNRNMMDGKTGQIALRSITGKPRIVYYAPVPGRTRWSMAIVLDRNEVYGSLRIISITLLLTMLLGMGMLLLILWLSVNNITRLHEAEMAKQRIDGELGIAHNIQMGMLPSELPATMRDDVRVQGMLLPAREVGGDLYDHFIRAEKLYFCIGDVSGKGVPAALVMAATRNLLRASTQHESNPARVMTAMNKVLTDGNDTLMFVTFFIGVLDLPTGKLRYCNAGHNAPWLLPPAGQPQLLAVEPNLPLGVEDGYTYAGQEIDLQVGSTVVLYTDGVTEAIDAAHNQFGDNRLQHTLEACVQDGVTNDPAAVIASVTEAVNTFTAGHDPGDDITMLVVHYNKPQRNLLLQRSLTVSSDVKQVTELNDFVKSVAEELKFDPSQAMQLQLAIEESVVNVMEYAYEGDHRGLVTVDCMADDTWLDVVITDNGRPFDPTSHPDADITLPTEKRDVGGLGILLTRRLMDAINYEHDGKRNVLTLRKRLK